MITITITRIFLGFDYDYTENLDYDYDYTDNLDYDYDYNVFNVTDYTENHAYDYNVFNVVITSCVKEIDTVNYVKLFLWN